MFSEFVTPFHEELHAKADTDNRYIGVLGFVEDSRKMVHLKNIHCSSEGTDSGGGTAGMVV